MNVNYYIQRGKVNRKGQTPVMLDLNWRGYRLQLSSGVMAAPENFVPDWPLDKQPRNARVLHTSEPNSLALNWTLDTLRLDLQKQYLAWDVEYGRQRDITPALVREKVSELLGRHVARAAMAATPKRGKTIWDYHEEWLQLYRHKYAENYLRKFHGVKQWLDQYSPHLELRDLNETWVQQYVNWMLETPSLRTGELPRNGTIGKHLGFFRAMLRFARLPYEWLQNEFTENTPGVDLFYSEVLAIRNGQYLTPELQQTADTYVLLTQLGLRYGDWLRLSASDLETVLVDGRSRLVFYEFRQGKTAAPVTVAFSDMATEIWQQYGGNLPKVANQTLNERLKYVGRAAGLTRLVSFTIARGKDYITEQKPLWQLLTAHTARHTAGSLLLEGSGGKELSQHTLGHGDKRSTNLYARPKQLQQIQETLAAWQNLTNKP